MKGEKLFYRTMAAFTLVLACYLLATAELHIKGYSYLLNTMFPVYAQEN